MSSNKLIYISAPFSKCSNIPKRINEITTISANFLKRGKRVICCSTLGDAFTKVDSELCSKTSEWWEEWWSNILIVCDKVYVLCFPGWEESYGVTQEIKLAKLLNKKIVYFIVAYDKNGKIQILNKN